MQRRHFKAIADAIRLLQPDELPTQERLMWLRTVDTFAEMCARQNPNFKRDRFLKACGAAE